MYFVSILRIPNTSYYVFIMCSVCCLTLKMAIFLFSSWSASSTDGTSVAWQCHHQHKISLHCKHISRRTKYVLFSVCYMWIYASLCVVRWFEEVVRVVRRCCGIIYLEGCVRPFTHRSGHCRDGKMKIGTVS